MTGNRRMVERMIESMTSIVGSWWFLVIHLVWFAWWLIAAADVNWLTLIVSLEAIILMIVLLMAENRRNMRDRRKADEDLHTDQNALKTGQEILKRVIKLEKQLSAKFRTDQEK